MIIEAFFKLLFGFADIMLSLLPEIKLNIDLPDTSGFKNMLGLADYFFPIGTLIAAVGVIVAIQNIQFILKIFNWIIKKIPFIN